MRPVISFITPSPYHKIYQNTLLVDELRKRDWDIQHNETTEKTNYLLCTSPSQADRTTEISQKYNIPYITWVPDIGDGSEGIWEHLNFIKYAAHIRAAYKVWSICTKMQWEIIRLTGRYDVDLVRPCIDNHTISSVFSRFETPLFPKKNQMIVVGALHHWKQPHIPFLTWKEAYNPKPKLIYLTYGHLDKPLDGHYNKNTMGVNSLYARQLMKEARGLDVEFRAVSDEEKYKIIAESKILICSDSFGTFNLPPIEAYFCHTHVLVSDTHEWIDLPFRHFKTNNILDLGNKLSSPFSDDKNWLSYLKKKMQEYTIESCADRLEEQFNNLNGNLEMKKR